MGVKIGCADKRALESRFLTCLVVRFQYHHFLAESLNEAILSTRIFGVFRSSFDLENSLFLYFIGTKNS